MAATNQIVLPLSKGDSQLRASLNKAAVMNLPWERYTISSPRGGGGGVVRGTRDADKDLLFCSISLVFHFYIQKPC